MSVGPHLSARLPLDGFPWDQMETCRKVCRREHPNFVKNGQKYRAPSMKTAGCSTVAESKLHNAQYSYIAVTCSSTLHTECIVAFPMRQCLCDAPQCHVRKGKLPVLLVLDYIFITNLMHWLLFIHKILFSSTCFEHQVLIFRRTQLYTCSIWYRHSL
jgi:hypothetical protein